MRLFRIALFLVGMTTSAFAAGIQKDPPPTQAEVAAAMYFVGFPLTTVAPPIRFISAKAMQKIETDAYIRDLHLKAVAVYRPKYRDILFQYDWRHTGGMLNLVHEIRHYWQDLKRLPTDNECDAFEVEYEYAAWHGYPTAGIVKLRELLKCKETKSIFPVQWGAN